MNRELQRLRHSMDSLFEDSLNRMTTRQPQKEQYLVPLADAWENMEEVVVQMALPGVDPETVDVTFVENTLTISGAFGIQEHKNRLLRELPRGQFRRQFTLHVPINTNQIQASSAHGLLSLRLPKSERIKPRKIAVKVA